VSRHAAQGLPTLPPATVSAAGDSGVRLRVADAISMEAHERVLAWLHALDAARPAFVQDVVPSYHSVLVIYDCTAASLADVTSWIDSLRARPFSPPGARRLVELPVWYDPEVAPDLAALAESKGLSVAELVALHSAPEYRVHMLGFRPGFPFLGGLDPLLAAPRLPSPRLLVPAGSVGIGGAQTGVYPVSSPGGWRLIGRTPARLFVPGAAEPFLFQVGDRVRFLPVDGARYRELLAAG
jgi:inhibitor of KinA